MKPRSLAVLLRMLREAGVTSYRDADVQLSFGVAWVPAEDGKQPADVDGDLELPPGLVDPRKTIAEIYKRRQKGA